MNKVALLFNLSLNELKVSLIQLNSFVIELEISLIPTFFHIEGVLAALESSEIELESSLIQLQIVANELMCSLIVHI